MKIKSERVFLILMIAAVVILLCTSCAWFGANPHKDGLVIPPNTLEVETPTAVEDVRG